MLKLNLIPQPSPTKVDHVHKLDEPSKLPIQQRDENTGYGSDSNTSTTYETQTNTKPDEEFLINHKNFLTKEHYQGAIMAKKKWENIETRKIDQGSNPETKKNTYGIH